MMKKLVLAVLVFMVLGTSACSQAASETKKENLETPKIQWAFKSEEIEGVEQREVGEGPTAAVILSAKGKPPSRRIAVYLHQWQAVPPSFEAVAVKALVNAGNTVIYPVYQSTDSDPRDYLRNAVAGIEKAIANLDSKPEGLVLVGSTTGGALAFDLAAVAVDVGLPRPVAAIALFPGRNPDGVIPRPDYTGIDSDTWLVALHSPDSRIPNDASESRRMMRLATEVPDGRKRSLRLSLTPTSRRDQRQIERSMWRRINGFMALARRSHRRS